MEMKGLRKNLLMKPITILVVGIPVVIAIALVPWLLWFGALPISENTTDWAAFGGYIGGVLSPLIAALALVALLLTIRQQQSEIDQLKSEAAKNDLVRTIEKLEADFERTLTRHPVKLNVAGKVYEYSGLDVVMSPSFKEYRQVLVTTNDVEELLDQSGEIQRDHAALVAFEMFGLAAGHLNQIRLYAEALERRTNSNALSRYYHRKYKIPYQRFIECQILVSPWLDEP